ncbi:hypothetical protein AAY473_006284 [Plecturocebus cupreus]
MGFHHVGQDGLVLSSSWSTSLGLPNCWDYRLSHRAQPVKMYENFIQQDAFTSPSLSDRQLTGRPRPAALTSPLHCEALTNPVVVSAEGVHLGPSPLQEFLLAVPGLRDRPPQLRHRPVLPHVAVEAHKLLLVVDVSHQEPHPLRPVEEMTLTLKLLQETCCGDTNDPVTGRPPGKTPTATPHRGSLAGCGLWDPRPAPPATPPRAALGLILRLLEGDGDSEARRETLSDPQALGPPPCLQPVLEASKQELEEDPPAPQARAASSWEPPTQTPSPALIPQASPVPATAPPRSSCAHFLGDDLVPGLRCLWESEQGKQASPLRWGSLKGSEVMANTQHRSLHRNGKCRSVDSGAENNRMTSVTSGCQRRTL